MCILRAFIMTELIKIIQTASKVFLIFVITHLTESKYCIRLIDLYNQIPYPAKKEITKYINWRQFTKGTRGKQNEQLFPK